MWWTQWPISAVGSGIWSGAEAAVDGLPGLAAVVGAEGAGGGDGDDDALRVGGVEEDGVEAHAAGAGLPGGAGAVLRRPESSCQVVAAVVGLEEGGVFDAGVDGVGVGEGGFEMPDAFELPGVRRAVVPLVGAGDAVVERICCRRRSRFCRRRRSVG